MLNDDNDNNRRSVEFCYRTNKTILNPIIDWEDEDVWSFLNDRQIPHCCLYDEGFSRLGCIGCPMGSAKGQRTEFERWPEYKKLYEKAFERMIQARKINGLPCAWKTAEEVFDWWLGEGEKEIPEDQQADNYMQFFMQYGKGEE